ncbi:disease resistance protein RPV1-like [Rhodamnia argentea]|uniref:Disease resistance protein RPV1-like n=1 Tax=Rhodamnia argentea TaxID=178133 RepID=A0ABM3H8W3_9MYRT|nr:disease resistance protein RPV1-like [Rhodamnia argentea]
MASSSSSSKPRKSYDVFLSFRGPDVRNYFLGHLYTALDRVGISTYKDDEELRKGERISTELMKAIWESRIAVVVFSKIYASSTWCLEELVEIMECKEQGDLMVFPVFYKVDPREVRTPRESYLEAMANHERKFEKDLERVGRWKNALSEAGSLSGWHFTDGSKVSSPGRLDKNRERELQEPLGHEKATDAAWWQGRDGGGNAMRAAVGPVVKADGSIFFSHFVSEYEAGFIQQIVEEISTQLGRVPLDVAKYPVGIDSRVQQLRTILNLWSKDDVLVVGLWGQGGVGKTTLAKAIYNAMFREFQGSSFSERVRENSKSPSGLVALQEKLLSEVLLGKTFKVCSVARGSCLIRDRLHNKKVLIILDDVDDAWQLDALAGNCQWFGNGSRIIITTRDKHILVSHGVNRDHMYEVEALDNSAALELFRKHAFQGNQEIEISNNLVDRVLHYARGLPLALEVLGSSLCGRGENQWKSTLQKLAKSPHKKINDVLKVSYDGLEDYAKEIFLDIACFFKGRDAEYIKKVLDSCDFDTIIGINNLIERCLIKDEQGTLEMHDLIQSMGMDIVKEECRDDPGKSSRLWLYDDVLDVLQGDVGTDSIKAIVLKLQKPEVKYISPSAFTNMRKLRLLILHNVENSFSGPIHLPNELRWFEWPRCASIPEFRDGPKKLVGLDLSNTNITRVLKQFKCFGKLKFINLSSCPSLVCMPDLSCTPTLKELDLSGCENLERAHESIAYHGKLQKLDLGRCPKLQRFPDIPNKNKSLREVYLNRTSIVELPASIGNLVSLEKMVLNDCEKLTILPSSIYRLQNLLDLRLTCCSKLIKFPKVEEDSSDPHTKTGFPMLSELYLGGCHLPELQEIPKVPEKLRSLDASGCKSLSRIPSNLFDVEDVELCSCPELVRNGLSVNDWFMLEEKFHGKTRHHAVLPGGEMPKWLLPNKEGYISFVVSKDLYKKFLGVAFCFVFRAEEERYRSFTLNVSVNGKHSMDYRHDFKSFNLDHVYLGYRKTKDMLRGDYFGPNGLSHFHFSIRVDRDLRSKTIVKKCGFRLICKPLENDLEVLLQDGQLLDPALLYEVGYEDSQMSSEEESSSETGDLQDSQTSTEEDGSSELVYKGFDIADFSIEKDRYSHIDSCYRKVRPGGEMPKEFVLVEGCAISFMASQDLYDKFLGLVLCVVFGVEDGKKEISFDIVPHVGGQRRNVLAGTLGSFDSDHVWIQYLVPNVLWGMLEGAVDFSQFEESYLQFSLAVRVSGGTVKKVGYLLSCRRLEDDLKVVLEDNQLMDLASLREESFEAEDIGWRFRYFTLT